MSIFGNNLLTATLPKMYGYLCNLKPRAGHMLLDPGVNLASERTN